MKMKTLKKKTKFLNDQDQESKKRIHYRKLESHVVHKHICKDCQQNIFISNTATH